MNVRDLDMFGGVEGLGHFYCHFAKSSGPPESRGEACENGCIFWFASFEVLTDCNEIVHGPWFFCLPPHC